MAQVVDKLEGLITVYQNGRVIRTEDPKFHCPRQRAAEEGGVNFKDVVVDQNNVWVRIYVPGQAVERSQKLPLILYFHGGGFCLASAGTPMFHVGCLKWAQAFSSIFISAHYRLSPENRLPAAFEDAASVLAWLEGQAQVDEWLQANGDFSRVFLMGDSAGGNIAHQLAFSEAAKRSPAEMTLKVKGMVLLYPFFGGEDRTTSEVSARKPCESPKLTLEISDMMWRLALPPGTNRDHPFCNPKSFFFGDGLGVPAVVVVIAGLDILKDRTVEYCEILKRKCDCRVEVLMYESEDHGFASFKIGQESYMSFVESVSRFIHSQSVHG